MIQSPQKKSERAFRVLADTPRYLVVDKAPGIAFHSEKPAKPGLLELVRAWQAKKQQSNAPRIYAVHRLDKVCSGIIIFAYGAKNANALGNLFRHRRVEKIYVALTQARAKKYKGLVSGSMQRSRRGSWKLSQGVDNIARTLFFSIALEKGRPGLRCFVLSPQTGRTHQLRVCMKSLGAPILGDPLYGRFDLAREEDRTYLHAYAIRLQLDQEKLCLKCPPSAGEEFTKPSFQKRLQDLGDPFEAMRALALSL